MTILYKSNVGSDDGKDRLSLPVLKQNLHVTGTCPLSHFIVFFSCYRSLRINDENFIVGQTVEVIDKAVDLLFPSASDRWFGF